MKLFTIYVVVGATGALIRTPENAIGLREDPIILQCVTNSASIKWVSSNTVVTDDGCTSSDRRFTTTSDSNATHCSLVVQGTNTTRLSGQFRCWDRTDAETVEAEAVVIIVGQYVIWS